jgi:predicted GNAT family N-acyltransferase
MHTVKQATTDSQLNSILQLRYTILRAPWSQPIETATDDLEQSSINVFIEDASGEVIACGRLQENENKVGQIRFMAVHEAYQGKGLGRLIVDFLEDKGRGLNLKTIELQARENAVDFYERSGYAIKQKSFLLWGQIQHYLMEKQM